MELIVLFTFVAEGDKGFLRPRIRDHSKNNNVSIIRSYFSRFVLSTDPLTHIASRQQSILELSIQPVLCGEYTHQLIS